MHYGSGALVPGGEASVEEQDLTRDSRKLSQSMRPRLGTPGAQMSNVVAWSAVSEHTPPSIQTTLSLLFGDLCPASVPTSSYVSVSSPFFGQLSAYTHAGIPSSL